MDRRQAISAELKKIRVGLGLTQLEFANLFNRTDQKGMLYTTRSDISRYELGYTEPTASKYHKFLSLIKDKPRKEA